MADKKWSEFPAVTTFNDTDLCSVVRPGDPSSTANKKITGLNFRNTVAGELYVSNNFYNGIVIETIETTVIESGGNVYLTLQKAGTGDLTIQFGNKRYIFDCTPAAQIQLTAGSDTAPTTNYTYIIENGGSPILQVSTTGWPAIEYAAIAISVVQTAASVALDKVYMHWDWTDHIYDVNDQGGLTHLQKKFRQQNADWRSGVAPTLTITPQGAAPDDLIFTSTSGIVYRLHEDNFPAFTGTPDLFVTNDSTTPYNKIDDLNVLLTDSEGNSMTDKRFSLVIWGAISENTGDCKLFVNLPSSTYTKNDEAIADIFKYSNYNIPADFKGVGFLIARYTLRHQSLASGTWTLLDTDDLRGQYPANIAGGGGISTTTEFSDNQFKIYNVTDSTKELVFDLSGMPTATARTLTIKANATIDQDLATTFAPTFAGLTLSNLTVAGGIVQTDGSGVFSSSVTLPDGTLATTQTPGDDTTKVATTAFVAAAVGVENLWDRVTGTPNYVIPHTITDDVGATAVRIVKEWVTDIESTNMPTVGGTSINANSVLDLTSGEVSQLANIDTTTISANQWQYVGALNQNLTTTSNVVFAQAKLNNLTAGQRLCAHSSAKVISSVATLSSFIGGTANQIIVADTTEGVTLSTPQDIHTGAQPTFTQVTLSTEPDVDTEAATKKYVDDHPVANLLEQSNVFYAATAGNDGNTGKNVAYPFLTDTAAITAADALSPTETTQIKVELLNDGVFDVFNLNVKPWINIDAPTSFIYGLNGSVIGDNNIINIGTARLSGGTGTTIGKLGVGQSFFSANKLYHTTGGLTPLLLQVSGGVLFSKVDYFKPQVITDEAIKVNGGYIFNYSQWIAGKINIDTGAGGGKIYAQEIDGDVNIGSSIASHPSITTQYYSGDITVGDHSNYAMHTTSAYIGDLTTTDGSNVYLYSGTQQGDIHIQPGAYGNFTFGEFLGDLAVDESAASGLTISCIWNGVLTAGANSSVSMVVGKRTGGADSIEATADVHIFDVSKWNDTLNLLTTEEITQLLNIGETTTISSGQWEIVGNLNQYLSNTNSVTFNKMTLSQDADIALQLTATSSTLTTIEVDAARYLGFNTGSAILSSNFGITHYINNYAGSTTGTFTVETGVTTPDVILRGWNSGKWAFNQITDEPDGQVYINQPSESAGIPVLELNQVDISEGVINFIAEDKGVISESTSSQGSVAVEINGSYRRIALY